MRKLHPAPVILLLVGGLAGALTVEALIGSPWAVAGIVVAGISSAGVSSRYIGDLRRGGSDGEASSMPQLGYRGLPCPLAGTFRPCSGWPLAVAV